MTNLEEVIEPTNDETVEIHNDQLTLHNPSLDAVGNYICKALIDSDKNTSPTEWAMIQVRAQPYIEDFGIKTSHTGKSGIVTDGDRLELTCNVHSVGPVNITWLRSSSADDDRSMVAIADSSPESEQVFGQLDPFTNTFNVPEQNIIIQKLGKNSKRLVIESVKHEHRCYYVCIADNGVTERTRKVILIRVKDKLVALWPFLGIIAELFILFTIIHIWETQRAYKELQAVVNRGSNK